MSLTDRVLGSRAVASAGRAATGSRPRVLAMHEVRDLDAFERQLVLLLENFHPVSATQVAEWHRGAQLPPHAVWFTFDDGDRSTIVDAAPILRRHRVPATVFVCPGLVDGPQRPWWDVVSDAIRSGQTIELDGRTYRDESAVRALKTVPDARRRAVVEALDSSEGFGEPVPVGVDDLRRWIEMGGDIGNHTWDHPCLDQCTGDEQVRQIDLAADWLDRHDLWDRRLFAYPNGDRTPEAERHLAQQGYELVALFDHALADRRAGALRVSRLRLDAGASAARTAAVTSGWHSGLFGLRSRLTAVTQRGSRPTTPATSTRRSG